MRLIRSSLISSTGIISILLMTWNVFAQQSRNDNGIKLIEAVKMTITKQPAIELQRQQVEINKGFLEIESGQFDLNLGIQTGYDYDDAPLTKEEELIARTSSVTTETSSYNVSLQKLFRTGVSVTPSVQNTITDTSTSPFDPEANSRVDFLINVPLMRGLGIESTGANEISARLIHEASLLQLRQTVAESVYNTVLSYWAYLETKETLDTLRDSEDRARTILEQVQQMVEADEVPAGDLQQLKANLENKTVSRISTEQQLLQAQQSLGLSMGLPFDEFRDLPLPVDSFPAFDLHAIESLEKSSDMLLEICLRNRGDYLAAGKIKDSAEVQVAAAENGLKSQLDLALDLGYQGLDQGYGAKRLITPFGRNVPGASASVWLNYLFPLQNNSAKGLLRQNIASLKQTDIQLGDLGRNIQSGVQISLSSLKNSALQLQRARAAIDSYRLAVQNEKDKFALGTATLLDIVNMEDKLVSAILTKLTADASYAAAIVQLRLQTGTLISADEGRFYVDESELLGISQLLNQ